MTDAFSFRLIATDGTARRGEIVTRTQLYEHLFDENESSLSNLLDVHVSNVRKKITPEFIVTRRGHGYCIE